MRDWWEEDEEEEEDDEDDEEGKGARETWRKHIRMTSI
jgi:hypothetical protein